MYHLDEGEEKLVSQYTGNKMVTKRAWVWNCNALPHGIITGRPYLTYRQQQLISTRYWTPTLVPIPMVKIHEINTWKFHTQTQCGYSTYSIGSVNMGE